MANTSESGGQGTGEHCGLSHRDVAPARASLGLRGSSWLREGHWEPEREGACPGSQSLFLVVHCLGLSHVSFLQILICQSANIESFSVYSCCGLQTKGPGTES